MHHTFRAKATLGCFPPTPVLVGRSYPRAPGPLERNNKTASDQFQSQLTMKIFPLSLTEQEPWKYGKYAARASWPLCLPGVPTNAGGWTTKKTLISDFVRHRTRFDHPQDTDRFSDFSRLHAALLIGRTSGQSLPYSIARPNGLSPARLAAKRGTGSDGRTVGTEKSPSSDRFRVWRGCSIDV